MTTAPLKINFSIAWNISLISTITMSLCKYSWQFKRIILLKAIINMELIRGLIPVIGITRTQSAKKARVMG